MISLYISPEWGAVWCSISVFVIGQIISFINKKISNHKETEIFRETIFEWANLITKETYYETTLTNLNNAINYLKENTKPIKFY